MKNKTYWRGQVDNPRNFRESINDDFPRRDNPQDAYRDAYERASLNNGNGICLDDEVFSVEIDEATGELTGEFYDMYSAKDDGFFGGDEDDEDE